MIARPRMSGRLAAAALAGLVALGAGRAAAEGPLVRYGDPVPRDVRDMYDAGIRYLIKTQDASGGWKDGQAGPGVTGMAVMVLLGSGEDPNYGPYRVPIRKALRSMIIAQDPDTGFLAAGGGHDSMYQHGFAMLALAEAYGAVDDRTLWTEAEGMRGPGQGRSLGQALELAVRCAVTSAKKNPHGAWRYSPDARDADTSVSGAVLMGLLGARNAGIEVPDETIDRAIKYYTTMTGANGQVGYSGGAGGGSDAVTSIAVLVYAIARQKELPQYEKALSYLKSRSRDPNAGAEGYPTYTRYYRAQALFQGDVEAWEAWNAGLVQELKQMQGKDGGFGGFAGRGGGFGGTVDTTLALLSLAVNYKFLPIYER
ncbi:MAG: squalene--hopene cyclase [Planctomycetota bacterium]